MMAEIYMATITVSKVFYPDTLRIYMTAPGTTCSAMVYCNGAPFLVTMTIAAIICGHTVRGHTVFCIR